MWKTAAESWGRKDLSSQYMVNEMKELDTIIQEGLSSEYNRFFRANGLTLVA